MTQTYKVQVSMNQAHLVESGFVWKQGDFGFNLEIEVLDFDTSGVTPQIIFRKSSGAVESTFVTQSGNKFTYTIRGTELDTPGSGICDLKLKNSTTQRISTASFKFFVIPDTEDGLNEQASSYSDTIAQLLGDVVHLSDTAGLVKNDGTINTTIEGNVSNQGNQINTIKSALGDVAIGLNKTFTDITSGASHTFDCFLVSGFQYVFTNNTSGTCSLNGTTLDGTNVAIKAVINAGSSYAFTAANNFIKIGGWYNGSGSITITGGYGLNNITEINADLDDHEYQITELDSSVRKLYEKSTFPVSQGQNYLDFDCVANNTYRVTNNTSQSISVKTVLNGTVVQTVKESLAANSSYDFVCTDAADQIYTYVNTAGNFSIENLSSWYYSVNDDLSNLDIYVNAKEYGVSTSAADNHDAIIAAINAAIIQKKPLYIEAGTYYTSLIELTYPSQLRIVGTGQNASAATIIRPTSGTSLIKFYGGNHCYFENIIFMGTIILADNSPNTSDCRFNDLYFNDCTFSVASYGVKIDAPCGYVKFDKCAFKCVKGISIGEDYQNTVSVIPNYIYIFNCEFFGITDTDCSGVVIFKGRVVKIQNCDFAQFNTNYPSLRVYANGIVDYIDIVENMFMNNIYPISVGTAPSGGYIQRIRVSLNGFDLISGGKGVYIDGGSTSGGCHEVQIVGNITSGASSDDLNGEVFHINNIGTLTFAQNEAHALLLAKNCISITNVSKIQDKSFMSDAANISINSGETKTLILGHKYMWYSADTEIWHTGDNISYTTTYDSTTNQLTVSITNNADYAQNIHVDLM